MSGAPPILTCACVLLGSTFVSGSASAQENQPPARIDPKRTEKVLDSYLEQQKRSGEAALPAGRTAQPATDGDTKPQFKLTSVSIVGAKTLSPESLAVAYHPYIGKAVSLADLAAISEKISDLYRAAGYHLSRAIVPPQDIEGGRLVVQVIEGSITDIVLKGKGAGQFGSQRLMEVIKAERPSRRETLEQQLLLANDVPGLKISDASIEEIGPSTGKFRLILQVETWHVFVALGGDNRGTTAVGPTQTYLASALNSVITGGDALGLNLSTVPDAPREQQFYRLSYELPIRDDGTRIGGAASYSEIWPDDSRRETRTRSQIESYSVWATVVARRSRESSAWMTVAARLTNDSEKDSEGVNYDDRIRSLGLTGTYQWNDRLDGSNNLVASVTHGADIFGASEKGDPQLSRNDGSGKFFKLNLSIERDQKLSDGWSIYGSAVGQIASTALLSSEEFYLGGVLFGRGYDSGELSGDNGIAGSLELRFDQKMNEDPIEGFQLYGFIDGGTIWNIREGADDTLSLASAGAGVRLDITRDLRAGVEVAWPLDYRSVANEDRDPRVFFVLSHSIRRCPGRIGTSCL